MIHIHITLVDCQLFINYALRSKFFQFLILEMADDEKVRDEEKALSQDQMPTAYDPALAMLIAFMNSYVNIGTNGRWDLYKTDMERIEELLKEYVINWKTLQPFNPEIMSKIFNICQVMFKDDRNKKRPRKRRRS